MSWGEHTLKLKMVMALFNQKWICLNTCFYDEHVHYDKSNRKAMNKNWSYQKANPDLKTKPGNK